MSRHAVAITGAAVAACIGDSLEDLAKAVALKQGGIKQGHPWSDKVSAPAGMLPNSWLEEAILERPDWKHLTKLQLIACRLVGRLLSETKLLEHYRPEEIGLSISTTSAGLENWLAKVTACGEAWSREKPTEWFDTKDHGGTLAEVILREFPIRGPDLTFSTACSGGALAVAEGAELIKRGNVKACIVGGLDVLSSMTMFGFDALQVMDRELCRPFATSRAGINLGEGGAFFVLESAPRSQPLGFIAGAGSATDYHHMTQPHPSGHPMAKAMRRCLVDAGWAKEQVNAINAHGTGTVANDAAEAKAVVDVFGDGVAFHSTKDLHGHCLAGAGPLELAVVLAGMRKGSFGECTITNSFGFGGHNVSIAVAKVGEKSSPFPNFPKRAQRLFRSEAVVEPRTTPTSHHPLWRRLTWSSKAILEAVAEFEKVFCCKVKNVLAAGASRIYYSTVFGEMEAGLTVAEGILKKDAVVSPTAFQQSVHNAPLAYLMQTLELDIPTVTLTSGAASLDKALWLASQDLLVGRCDIAFVVNAAEYHVPAGLGGATGYAEVILLTTLPDSRLGVTSTYHNTLQLESIGWLQETSSMESNQYSCRPLKFSSGGSSGLRVTNCGQGRVIQSCWLKPEKACKEPRSAYELLPHRPPMLFVKELTDLKPDGSAACAVELEASALYFKDGNFQTHWLVEIMAQAIGMAFNASQLEQRKTLPKLGYLLSIDEFEVGANVILKPKDVLDVRINLDFDLFPLGKYSAKAFLGGERVASGTMKFFCGDGELGVIGKNGDFNGTA